MEVITREDLLLLRVEPLLDLEMGALRAGAVPAGVVPDLLDVSFRTSLRVASQRGGATAQKGTRRFPLVKRQRMGLQVLREARFENRLQGGDGGSTSRSSKTDRNGNELRIDHPSLAKSAQRSRLSGAL